jgi:hypothetical protein
MNIGKINIITPPDKLFNLNSSLLLVNPSLIVKQQMQKYLSRSIDEVNVFVYDDTEQDLDWLLSVHCRADVTVIDIDNCDPTTKLFVTYMIAHPETYYLSNDEITPYGLISKNRIYDLDAIPFFHMIGEEDVDDEEEGEQ